MCGITGFTGDKDPEMLNHLLAVIEHRGRDERAVHISENVSMGINRFAIVDLSKGLYPMYYKDLCMVYNGEIYNFKDIKRQLISRGVKFKSGSDAEVILPLYDLYGQKSFSMLEGMFSLAIYDSKNHTLILARDKSGEKPIYYTIHNKRFFFSSELKGLLQIKNISKKINRSALYEYLRHGSVSGGNTLVTDFYKIPPSSFIFVDVTKNTISQPECYWHPKIDKKLTDSNEADLADILESLIEKSVNSRMLSDVPLGVFLSGGVDSSLITYFAAKKKSGLRTYSISFPDFKSHYNESAYSQSVSKFLNTKHTELQCTAGSIKKIIKNIEKYIDEPIDDPAFLPTMLLAKEARKQVKVVLTGDGADELFAGYYRYQKELFTHNIRKTLGMNTRIIHNIEHLFSNTLTPDILYKTLSALDIHYSPLNIWTDIELNTLLSGKHCNPPSAVSGKTPINDPLLFMQESDLKRYLSEQVLMKSDKAGMIENLELRAPYLDTKIINFSFGLPSKYKIRNINGKYLLRKIAERHLPRVTAWRQKRGFSVPLGEWFRDPLSDFIKDSCEMLEDYPELINIPYFMQKVRMHMENKGDFKDKMWTVLLLARWMKYNNINT